MGTDTERPEDEAPIPSARTTTQAASPIPQAMQPAAMSGRKLHRQRKWLFRLIAATVIPTLVLGLLELGLRVCGYGYPTSFFIERPAPDGTTVYAENVDFGRRFFPPGLGGQPLTQMMPKEKGPGVYRIFILGESAAQGFPDPASSFSRILEVILRATYPDTHFEVVNTSMTAINSHVVQRIASECARHQPDLFVVYLGNNEIVGPFGVSGVLGSFTPSLGMIQSSLFVKRTRTGQLLGSTLRGLSSSAGPKSWDGWGMFQNSQVQVDDPRIEATVRNFRSNLRDICRSGTESGAQVVVCTIPVNLRDSAPFASLHRPGLIAEQTAEWERVYAEGVDLENAGRLGEAVARYEAASAIDDRFADLAFRMARCCRALGKTEQAGEKYRRARDLDALRFRADSRINVAIRDIANSIPSGVHLVDAELDFAALSPEGVPGENLFLEHVHMNLRGNYSLAASVFRTIVREMPLKTRQVGDGTPIGLDRCAEQLAYGVWTRYKIDSAIRSLLLEQPFRDQLDHAERAKRLDAQVNDLQRTIQTDTTSESIGIFKRALNDNPGDWITRVKYAQFLAESNIPDQAIEQYRVVIQQVPHHYEALRQQGNLQLAVGDLKGAKDSLERAIKIYPNFTLAHYDLANVLVAEGKYDEAITTFTNRVNKEPNRADALAFLANFLLKLGYRHTARERLDEALQINPDDAIAHMIMGHLLGEEGAVEEAVAHYQAAVRSKPSSSRFVDKFIDDLRKAHDSAASPRPK
ncbi:MAG TPA: tetratricopeptide repeat protein [Gemmata sp.]|jgi:tetratricopeptide (TPR) repeat protein|nr:tetratricopeptide repeat protein [Gemmata sp.]